MNFNPEYLLNAMVYALLGVVIYIASFVVVLGSCVGLVIADVVA